MTIYKCDRCGQDIDHPPNIIKVNIGYEHPYETIEVCDLCRQDFYLWKDWKMTVTPDSHKANSESRRWNK